MNNNLPFLGNIYTPSKPVGIHGVHAYYPHDINVDDLVLAQSVTSQSELEKVLWEHGSVSILRNDGSFAKGLVKEVNEDIKSQPHLYRVKAGNPGFKITNVNLPNHALKKICNSSPIDDYRKLVTGFDPFVKQRPPLDNTNFLQYLSGYPFSLKDIKTVGPNYWHNKFREIVENRFGTRTLHHASDGNNYNELEKLIHKSYNNLSYYLSGANKNMDIGLVLITTITDYDGYAGILGKFLSYTDIGPISTTEIKEGCCGYISQNQHAIFSIGFLKNGTNYMLGLTGDLMTVKSLSDWKNRALLSDGATATLFGPCEEGTGILGTLRTNLPYMQHTAIQDYYGGFDMYGPGVANFVKEYYPLMVNQMVKLFKFDRRKLYIISHQMNGVILSGINQFINNAKLAGEPNINTDQVINVVSKYGNNSSSTIPTAIYQCMCDKLFCEGDELILIGAGAGFNIGCTAMRVNKAMVEYQKKLNS